jgi:hypothetical protein
MAKPRSGYKEGEFQYPRKQQARDQADDANAQAFLDAAAEVDGEKFPRYRPDQTPDGYTHMTTSMEVHWGEGDDDRPFDQWAQEEGLHPEALTHEGMSPESVVTMLRMKGCLAYLAPDQEDLLFKHAVGRETLEELAEEEGKAKQSLWEREQTAKHNLVRAVADHWLDPLNFDYLPVQGTEPPPPLGGMFAPRGKRSEDDPNMEKATAAVRAAAAVEAVEALAAARPSEGELENLEAVMGPSVETVDFLDELRRELDNGA